MKDNEHQKEAKAKAIYMRAIDREAGRERDAFIEGACADDPSLYDKVSALLRAHAEDSFLEAPAIENGDTLLDSAPEAPGTVIGRYKILQSIGEGGFGTVYMAEQKEPVKRRVALKIIKLGMDTKQVVARFEAERQALAMMDHPNIAKVLDAGATDAGRPYFVMELVRGISITQYCDENNLSALERLKLFMDVCSAIQHAHQKGIIHRDIKPSNIMITLHDGEPVPKVIDFGIAKATQQELTEKTLFTQYSQFIGTPAYMSPEQAEMSGLDVDTRSDIYSLGVLLYELLTGRTPLDRESLMSGGYDEIRRRIREEEPSKPSTRVSTMIGEERTKVAKQRNVDAGKLSHLLRGDLDWVVMKALEKDRTRRYETANALRSDVQRFLNNEPVTAVKPSATYLLSKYVRRHKTVVSFAATIAILLIAATVISGSLAVKANRAQKAQEELTEQANQATDEAIVAKEQAEEARQQLQENNRLGLIEQARAIQTARVQGYRNEVIHLIEQANVPGVSETMVHDMRNLAVATLLDPKAYPYEILKFEIPHAESLTKMRQFKDKCAFGYEDGHIGVHDHFHGDLLFELKGGHQKPISSMVHLHMANRWVSVDVSGCIIVWRQKDRTDAWEPSARYDVQTNGSIPQLSDAGEGFVLGYFRGNSLTHWPKANQAESKNIPLKMAIAPFSVYPWSTRNLPISVDRKGQWLAIGLNDSRKIQIHDLSLNQDFMISIQTKEEPFMMIPYFSDHQDFLMGFGMNYIGVFQAGSDWDLLEKRKDTGNKFLRFAAFAKEENKILFQGERANVHVWDFKENQIKETFEDLAGMPGYAPDGESLVFTDLSHWNDDTPVWKMIHLHSTPNSPVKTLKTGNAVAKGSEFNSTGEKIAVTTNYGVQLFNAKTLNEISLDSNEDFLWPNKPSFSSDDRLLASIHTRDHLVYIWNTQTGSVVKRQLCTNPVGGASFNKVKPILGASGRGFVQFWNYSLEPHGDALNPSFQLNEIYTHILGENELVGPIQYSDDGRYAAYVAGFLFEGQLYVLDLESERLEPKRIGEPEYTVESNNGFDFLANSHRLVFWETTYRQGRRVVSDIHDPNAVTWISDWIPGYGSRGFYASPQFEYGVECNRKKIELVRLNERQNDFESITDLPVSDAGVNDVTWGDDMNTMAVSLDNGEVRIWNIAELRRQLAELGLDWESAIQN